VEKEVIVEKRVEIPVEVIKEVEKIVEVIKEVPIEIIKEVEKVVEVIKEVPVEKIVVKTVTIYDNSNENELLLKVQDLDNILSEKNSEFQKIFHYNQELEEKCKEITELNDKINNITVKNEQDKPAVYLRSSNLNDNLYKD
jgi:uncharacterized radical SAM superfamily Fe-S cluster-containing enzyme